MKSYKATCHKCGVFGRIDTLHVINELSQHYVMYSQCHSCKEHIVCFVEKPPSLPYKIHYFGGERITDGDSAPHRGENPL